MKNGNPPLEVVVLGSGSSVPDPLRGNPSVAIVVEGEPLLFDCGERATVNLVRADINPLTVNRIFFTHLHWDHIADFNYFLMTVWNCGRSDPLYIVGPEGTQEMIDGFLAAHHLDVRFIREFSKVIPGSVLNPELELNVTKTCRGVVAESSAYRVIASQVDHLASLGIENADWAYRVETSAGTVVYSGDTAPCDEMVDLARGADILIHEAAFLDEIIEARAMQGHSGPRGAGRVAQQAGVKKLVLTHIGPYDSHDKAVEMASLYYGERRGPEIWSKMIQDAATEYDGPIVVAEDAMRLRV
jgi:ribonuclease Z